MNKDGKLRIEPFSLEDYDEIRSLWRRCEGVGWGASDSREAVRRFLERNPEASFTAKKDDILIGTVLAGQDARRGYLYHLAVHPDFRRQGVGRKLVERSLEALQEAGLPKCHLFVFQDNPLGIAFWEALGWKERTDLKIFSKTLCEEGEEAASPEDALLHRAEKKEMEGVAIRFLTEEDWGTVRTIYEEGIATGQATFETEAPTWEEWNERHLPACRLAAVSAGKVAGWAALSRVSSRKVYTGVAEVSIYVAAALRGRGLGSRLLQTLITESEKIGVWTLQAGIFPENAASIRLHQKCGFRLIGRRERLGRRDGHWQDVLLFERRSRVAGA